jgi:hypothetical protein
MNRAEPDWSPRLPNGLIDRAAFPYVAWNWDAAIAKANSRARVTGVRQSVRTYLGNLWLITPVKHPNTNREPVVAVVHTVDPERSIQTQNAGYYEAIRQVIDELEGYADEGSDHIAYLQDFAMHITAWLPPEERPTP